MERSPSALNYNAPVQPKISKPMVFIVCAGVIALVAALVVVVR